MPKIGSVRAFLLSTLGAALICGSSPASADPIVSLGTASSYAVLAGSTVTNTGFTVLNGDLGVSPGSAITGFGPTANILGPGIYTGTNNAGNAAAGTAENDLTTAYNSLWGLDRQSSVGACDGSATNLTGQDLGGKTLVPGVYCFTSSAQLTGTLKLNELGQTDPKFVFQIGSTLTTASNSAVTEINGGTNNDILWQIGSSATLGTGTDFLGDIVALTSITLTTGASISCGAALARNGAVTLDDNAISICALDGITPVPVPEPSTLIMLGTALFALIGIGWRRSRLA